MARCELRTALSVTGRVALFLGTVAVFVAASSGVMALLWAMLERTTSP